MAEDWASIAEEVDAAIKSVGSTDAGFPAVLRRVVRGGANPYDPAAGYTGITYSTIRVIESNIRERDRAGTLIGTKRRTLTVGTGTGVVPLKSDKIALGITEDLANERLQWQEIDEVYPLAPSGTVILFEIDLVV